MTPIPPVNCAKAVNTGAFIGAFSSPKAVTKAVVASCVVFVPAAAVGAFGRPVNVGDAMFAGVYPRPEVMFADVTVVTLPAVAAVVAVPSKRSIVYL